VIREEDIFIEGERRLGRYTVVILQRLDADNWVPSVMQLNTLISNYRIVLQPFKRKYAPATLPAHYIRSVELTKTGNYNCVGITLMTDDVLYLMLGTGNLLDLYDDLRVMKTPPPKYKFDESVARTDIKRLIDFLRKDGSPSV
jgi:hypothetical protein